MPDRYALGHDDNRDLDALVDEALASYTGAEPDPSLRVRIMANAAEASPRPKQVCGCSHPQPHVQRPLPSLFSIILPRPRRALAPRNIFHRQYS